MKKGASHLTLRLYFIDRASDAIDLEKGSIYARDISLASEKQLFTILATIVVCIYLKASTGWYISQSSSNSNKIEPCYSYINAMRRRFLLDDVRTKTFIEYLIIIIIINFNHFQIENIC